MPRKEMIVPMFKASLLSSQELYNNELKEESVVESRNSPKNLGICFGDPVVKYINIAEQPRSALKKSRSTISATSLQSSRIGFYYSNTKFLRSDVSKSPESRYFTSRSRSLSSVVTSRSKSQILSRGSGSTYTIATSNSVCAGSPPSTLSLYSYSVTFSAGSSLGSSSLRSGSHTSRTSCSRSKFHDSRSRQRKRSCESSLLVPASQRFKSPPSKTLTVRNSSVFSPKKTLHKRASLLKSPLVRSPLPTKSCLRSPASNSPDKRSPLSRPSCLKSCKSPCLKSPISISINSKSLSFKSKKSHPAKSLSPTALQSKSKPFKSVSFKSISSKSISTSNQSRNSIFSKASFNSADSTPKYLRYPQYSPSSKSPCVRFVEPINSPSSKPLTPDLLRSRDWKLRVLHKKHPYVKHLESNRRPKLTFSKVRESKLSVRRSRCSKQTITGQKLTRLKGKLNDYQELSSRLKNHLENDLNKVFLEKTLEKKMDVRYITDLKSYFERLKSTFTCSTPVCPGLQERRRRHKLSHHAGQVVDGQPYADNTSRNCPAMLSRWDSHNSVYHNRSDGQVPGSEAQTRITLANLGGVTISLETRPISTNTSTAHFVQEPDQPVNVRDPTEELKALKDSYKQNVESEIDSWSKKVPVKEDTPSDVQRKGTIIQNLKDRVRLIDLTKRDTNTQKRLRNEIDSCLENLKLWYPGSNADREAYKEGLWENLTERILYHNDRYTEGTKNVEDSIGNNNNPLKNKFGQVYGNNGSQPYGSYKPQNVKFQQSDKPWIDPDNTQKVLQDEISVNFRDPAEKLKDLKDRYNQNVESEIDSWSKKVPVKQDTPSDVQRTGTIFQNLRDRVRTMDLTKRDTDTVKRLRNEIDSCLENLNLRFSGSNADRKAYKDELRENLIERIFYYNDKYVEGTKNVEDTIGNNLNPLQSNVGQYYDNHGSQSYANHGNYGPQNISTPYGDAKNAAQPYASFNAAQPYGPAINTPQTYGTQSYRNASNLAQPYETTPNIAQMYGASTNLEQPYGPGANAAQSYGTTPPTAHPYGPGTNVAQPYETTTPNRVHPYRPGTNGSQPYRNTSNTAQPYGQGTTQSHRTGTHVAQPYVDANNFSPDASQPYGSSGNTMQPYVTASKTAQNNISYGTQPVGNLPQNYRTGSYTTDEDIQIGISNDYPRTSIRIHDHPSYENQSHTPDNLAQPRRTSLKSNSNSRSSFASHDPNALRNDRIPNLNARPISRNESQNLTNYPSYTIDDARASSNKRQMESDALCNRYYDLSNENEYSLRCISKNSQVDQADELLDMCKNCLKRKLNYSDQMKCTIKSTDMCCCPDEINIPRLERCCGIKEIDMKREVADWLRKCTFIQLDGLMNRQQIVEGLVFHITPYLNLPCEKLSKAVLKTKIMNYLRSIGVCVNTTSCNTKIMLNKLANELANRLVGIVSRLEYSGPASWKCHMITNRPFRRIEQVHVGPNDVNREDLKHDLIQEFELSVHGTNIESNREILETIAELVINKIELIRQNINETARNEIISILESTHVLSDEEINNVVNSILYNARHIVMMIVNINNRTDTTARPCISGTLSIYTSEHDITPNFVGTSTPKKKKGVSKISPEGNTYTNIIASVVREWINTVPNHFENLKDRKMNEIMIMDLAGEIADHIKLGQLIPHQSLDTGQIMKYYIYKWLLKFEIVDDLESAESHAEILVDKLQNIEVPKLTRPQHGTRQAMKNIKYNEAYNAWTDPFIPEARDILEDEISIWMNEYPSNVYLFQNQSAQIELIHSFAEKLQKHNKNDDKGVSEEIKKWLKSVVKPTEKHMINKMSESLKERIDKLPQDAAIAAKIKEKLQMQKSEVVPTANSEIVNREEGNKTMKEFIIKYVEHSYDQEDPLAKAVYAKLLKLELQRLSPHVLQEVYDGNPLERVTPDRLFRELLYIKDISDWLKTLPFEENYNRLGNNDRIEFCLYLAKDIAQTEGNAMDDQYIRTIICQFMHQLPIKFDNTNLAKYINELLNAICIRRQENLAISPHQEWEDIAEFLDDYVRLNGQDIADDEVKLEMWATRLLKEIKRMITENPSALTVSQVHNNLAQVAKPGDETIIRFNHELDYATEISDWLKNLPLASNVDEEMIRDLAEEMAECENETNDSKLVQYLKQWILQLPLDNNKQIDVPFVIQQLLNRKKKVIEKKVSEGIRIDRENSKEEPSKYSGAKLECRGCCPVDDLGSVITQVIKDWCDNLPLKGSEDDIRSFKNDLLNKLYQTIIEINDDPHLARSDILYIESLSDKVRELLASLPMNVTLKDDANELRIKLLDLVKQARLFCKDVSMGDDYIKDLENAIEAIITNPVLRGVDPAFEIYKEFLTELFILENFDHGNDTDKLKYENAIKKQMEKFSANAQQRKGVPVTKEKLYNDTERALFDVVMPEEKALVDNVEEIKTKCEIQDWVEQLPFQPVIAPGELVNREQKIKLLAKKIHTLESENNSDQRIHKEITKWLKKMPLLPGEEGNIELFANNLQQILKSSRKRRKCVKASDVDIGKRKSAAPESYDLSSIWVNPNTTTDTDYKRKPQSRPKAGDIMLDILEQWSQNIPLPTLPKETIDAIKGDLTTRIIKKISELNNTPNVFNDDQMYYHLMSQGIENALAALPQTDTLMQGRYALIHQLTSAIESTKPLLQEERALYEYKNDLQKTVTSILGHPENPTPVEQNLLSRIQEEIITDFIEYQYNKDDEEGKQFYKNKMLDALTEYNFIGEKEDNRNEIISDTLVEVNKLICDLKKIPCPGEQALKNEVEELRMKREVDNFLNKVSPTEPESINPRRVTLRDSLAIQLNDIEKTGHDEDNNRKMEAAVARTLKKLDSEAKEDEVKTFIYKLQENEYIRKAPAYKEHGYGNFSMPGDFGANSQWVDPGSFAHSVPISPNMYVYDNQRPILGPQNVQYLRPAQPSPSRALKELMGYPPTDSVSYDYSQPMNQEVEVSVYRPDYVPPDWKPPKPHIDNINQDLLVVMPPIPGPIDSNIMPVTQKLAQPTQTKTFSSGVTQTSSPLGLRPQGPYGPPGQFLAPPPPHYPQSQPPQFASGQYNQAQPGQRPLPAPPQVDPRMGCAEIPQGAATQQERHSSEDFLLDDGCLCDMCRCYPCDSDSSFECRPLMMPYMMPSPFMFC